MATIFTASVTENISLANFATVVTSFSSQTVENLVLLDTPFARGWYAIDGQQTGSWINIDNSESSTWASINDGPTVVWVKVNNNYP